MANTTSWAFPNIFNIIQNKVNIVEDGASIVNRTRLLILTEPTELYYNPTFGVGLKRYLWQYNNENTKAMIKDRIVDQLREHEPSVAAEETTFADGLLFSESALTSVSAEQYNQLKMTVGLQSIYGDNLSVDLSDLQSIVDSARSKVKPT